METSKSGRRVYALKGLSPEVVSVTFAKCSRSPEPFDEIAKELNAEKSAKFHEKWVVGYGHSSVSEHAVISLALENVSVLATKVIEDNRLCSFTEKSTRYQVYDRDRYYKPAKLMASPLGKEYEQTANSLMDFYARTYSALDAHYRKLNPQGSLPAPVYESRIKNLALDSARFILPVSILTNLGMTANARNLEHAIRKMLSHPMEEMNSIAEDLKSASSEALPTLMKAANPNDYIKTTQTRTESRKIHEKPLGAELVGWDGRAEDKLVAALLCRFSGASYAQALEEAGDMTMAEKEKFIDDLLGNRAASERPPRELEYLNYVFDIVIDYGSFRDIQRHRICTQTSPEFTPALGYEVPRAIEDAGLGKEFRARMDAAKKCYSNIYKQLPSEAAYILPMAYRKRVLFGMNLRELFHFIELRSGRTGHASYKKIAVLMADLLMEKHPAIAKHIKVKRE